jgi:predicted enzyme related to lactoylglutathione lyase
VREDRGVQVKRLETVVQFCSDVARSTSWYSKLLGEQPTPYETTYFRFGSGSGYLILAPAAPGTVHGGSGVWFEVDDVDAAHAALVADGFAFNEAPFSIAPGRLVTLLDPDGNLVGLIDNSAGGMPGRGIPA